MITDKDREAAIKFATESEEDSPWHAANDGFLAGCEHARAEQGVPVKWKCEHPDESVITISGKHSPWQGICELCGEEVSLKPIDGIAKESK